MYWRGIDPDTHLGYRRGKRGGRWVVRWREGIGYQQVTLGTADDKIGIGTLTYDAANKAARNHVKKARIEAKARADGPPLTVRLAIKLYIEYREAREKEQIGRTGKSDMKQRLGRHVLGQSTRGDAPPVSPIADIELHKLKEDDLRSWRDGLPTELKTASKGRLLSDLKAALNRAYEFNRDKLPPTVFEIVKYGLKANQTEVAIDDLARSNQILSDAEVGRLLRAARKVDEEQEWHGDFYRLAVVLAATGSRFSQLIRMRVRDVQIDNRRMMVPVSWKGQGRKLGHSNVPIGADVIEVLAPILTGRDGEEMLFERWRYKQSPGTIVWHRSARAMWRSSSEFSRPWKATRELADMPNVIPYALRHSSIVRGIRANLPIRLVAALHDTSVQMIERHYSRWITDGLDDLAAAAVVSLVPEQSGDNVVTLQRQDGEGAS